MMIKLLFFDYSDLESGEGFVRSLEPPAKHAGNPSCLWAIHRSGSPDFKSSIASQAHSVWTHQVD
jgi:hypothetical protein